MQKCLKVLQKKKKTKQRTKKERTQKSSLDEMSIHPSLTMEAFRTARCSWFIRAFRTNDDKNWPESI